RLADRLEHAIDGRRHQRGRAYVSEGALGRIVLVGAAAADHLDDLGGDLQARLGGQELGLVGEVATLGQVGRLPAGRRVLQQEAGGVETHGQAPDVALYGRILGDRDVLGLDDTLLRVVDREVERRLGDAEVDRGVAEPEALDHTDLDGRPRPAERGLARDVHAGEGYRGAVGAAHAEGVPLAVGGDPVGVGWNQRQ